jgi:uncharacterized protein
MGTRVTDAVKRELFPNIHSSFSVKPYLDIMNLLLAHGADINYRWVLKRTALFLAIQSENPEAVKLLLKFNADVNIRDQDGISPLMLANKSNLSLISSLLADAGAMGLNHVD